MVIAPITVSIKRKIIMTTTTKNTMVKVSKKTLPSTETIFKEKNNGSTPNPKGRVDPDKRVGAMAKLLK